MKLSKLNNNRYRMFNIANKPVQTTLLHASYRSIAGLIAALIVYKFNYSGQPELADGIIADIAIFSTASIAAALISSKTRRGFSGLSRYALANLVGIFLFPLGAALLIVALPNNNDENNQAIKLDRITCAIISIVIMFAIANINIPYAIAGAIAGSAVDYLCTKETEQTLCSENNPTSPIKHDLPSHLSFNI